MKTFKFECAAIFTTEEIMEKGIRAVIGGLKQVKGTLNEPIGPDWVLLPAGPTAARMQAVTYANYKRLEFFLHWVLQVDSEEYGVVQLIRASSLANMIDFISFLEMGELILESPIPFEEFDSRF